MEREKEARNHYLDIVKGMAIVFVVFGHCIQYGSGNEFFMTQSFFGNMAFKFIYSFHMPLFMLVSGYLFYYSVSKHSTKEIVKSRFTTLLLPILSWCVLLQVFKITIKIMNGTEWSMFYVFKTVIKECIYSLWFLWAVFYCSLAVVLVKKFCKDQNWVYLIMAIVSIMLPNKLNSQVYIFMFPYFIVGYLWNRNQYQLKLEKLKTRKNMSGIMWGGGFALFAIVYFLLLNMFDYNSYIYTSGISVWNKDILNQLGINLFRWTIGFVGSGLILLLLKFLTVYFKGITSVWRLLSILGRKSLGIYIISEFLFEYILLKVTKGFTFHYMVAILEMLVVVITSLILTLMLERYQITRRLFLGGR